MTAPSPADPYNEVAPHPRLRPWVECVWTRGAAIAETPSHRILPDGCVDIVAGCSAAKGGALAAAYAVGTMTRPLVVPSGEHTAYVGVRFRPGRARTVHGIPAHELTDQRADIELLWRAASPALALLHEAQDTTALTPGQWAGAAV